MTPRKRILSLMGAGLLLASAAVAQAEMSTRDQCLLSLYVATVAKESIEHVLAEFPDQAREPLIACATKLLYETQMDEVRVFYDLMLSQGMTDVCSR